MKCQNFNPEENHIVPNKKLFISATWGETAISNIVYEFQKGNCIFCHCCLNCTLVLFVLDGSVVAQLKRIIFCQDFKHFEISIVNVTSIRYQPFHPQKFYLMELSEKSKQVYYSELCFRMVLSGCK